jgi:pimeloyl-ACP methyl ester carboxylesterase
LQEPRKRHYQGTHLTVRRVGIVTGSTAGTWAPKRIEIDATALAYIERGRTDAEPIVLLHGYLGSHLSWRHLIEPLAARHRVVALDWFGWGASGRNPELAYHYDAEVDRLRRTLQALGLGSYNLFGHDYGGFLGLGLCQRHPGRVRRLALLNTRAHGTFTRRWAALFGSISALCRSPALGTVVARLPLGRVHRRLCQPGLEKGIFDERSLDSYVGWMSRDPEGGRFYARFFRDYEVRPRADLAVGLSGISCPTAVVWGRRDPYLPLTIPSELSRDIPGAALTMIDGAGHFVMEERPADVQRALARLLDRPV